MAEATIFVQQNSPMALLRQGGVLVGIAAAVALGVYVVMWSRTPHFTMLYSDLSDRDLTQIVEALKSSQTPYRIEPGSGAVLVELEDSKISQQEITHLLLATIAPGTELRVVKARIAKQ